MYNNNLVRFIIFQYTEVCKATSVWKQNGNHGKGEKTLGLARLTAERKGLKLKTEIEIRQIEVPLQILPSDVTSGSAVMS